MSGTLSPEHRALLEASAISDEIADARGYFTATTAAELGRLGFDSYQRIAPALVLPVWGVDGQIVNYQARPDRPRVDRERGREVRYETVAGSVVQPDVPPACRPHLGAARRPLWITEGIRKGDALASRDLCAIALLGVDCFHTDDWDRIALDERNVYVVYDNDVMHKAAVHDALERLAKLLTAKGAIVHYVYLPEDNGKIGVDDYFAAGHTVDELYRLATPELRAPPAQLRPHGPAAWPTMWLLDSIEKLLGRFVRFPSEHERCALTLFAAHTWTPTAWQAVPYLLVVSPEKRSGKTRTLEALELVVREPLRAANITAAGVFQAIEAWTPTLLVDELDAIFRAKSEQAEALRAVLNAGNRRGSYVVRGSQDGKPVKFSTYCAKALSGINTGKLPDTIRDRSILLAIERKQAGERVEDLFPAELADVLEQLRGRLEDWAAENVEQLGAWRRRERIGELDDRLQEAWDPLLAIAHHAGGGWPARARAAAIALATGAVDASDEAHGHVLLVALRAIFDADGAALASKTICEKLNDDEELPFGGYGDGTGIAPRGLAKLLRPYGIKPRTVRPAGETATSRGYNREQFAEAWARYAPEHTRAADPSAEATQATQATHPSPDGKLDVSDVSDVSLPGLDVGDMHGSSNGQGDVDDYAARYRKRQAEGAWGAEG